jgi:hypothetical protein
LLYSFPGCGDNSNLPYLFHNFPGLWS